jgi:hypothetical protein
MNARTLLLLLCIIVLACNDSPEQNKQSCTCESDADNRFGRGALLATRFPSFDSLKSVIQIEYVPGAKPADSTAAPNRLVRVRHCSAGKEVLSVLEAGISQGDIMKARGKNAFNNQLKVLLGSPFAVASRKDMEIVLCLSRWSLELFGEGDQAFFDMAKLMVSHINTPDLAILTPRDSTEKGFQNTFNHITAQALMTSCFSEELADFIGDSHELYRLPELVSGNFTMAQISNLEDGAVDNYVDLINNEWGQELGKQLKSRYKIHRYTRWTPELLANYLNDLQSYFSWAFQIGFEPCRPSDEPVQRFSHKLDVLLSGAVKVK